MSDQTHRTHGYAFDDQGRAVAVEEFPWDAVADRLDGPSRQVAMDAMRRAAAAQALDRTLWVLLVQSPKRDHDINWRTAAHNAGPRAIALAYVIRHRTTSEIQSLRHLAELSGIDRKALQRAAVMVAREFGIPLEIARKYTPRRRMPGHKTHMQDDDSCMVRED